MENQTRFDLNEALAKWRAEELESQPGVSTEAARELESHLRDSVVELQAKGLPEEEAFWLAQRRLGSTEKIGAEFAKAEPARVWTERVFWMVAGVLVMNVLFRLAFIPLSYFQAGSSSGQLNPNLLALCFAAVYSLILGVALLVARGKLSKAIQMLTKLLNTRKRLIGVVVLIAVLQGYHGWIALWKLIAGEGNSGIPNHILPSTVTYNMWPLALGFTLVYLWTKVPSRETTHRS